jgi:hypothetical protein
VMALGLEICSFGGVFRRDLLNELEFCLNKAV